MRRRTAQITRQKETETRRRDEFAPVAELTSDELVAVIYRLQSRRRFPERIRELVTEQERRRAAAPMYQDPQRAESDAWAAAYPEPNREDHS